ncbi:MAG: heme/hemin ABC transporter substrate-binding protein [Shewanella sp.]
MKSLNLKQLIGTALFSLLTVYCAAALATEANSPRIISAGSTVTEMLLALGAKDKIIAADLTSKPLLSKTEVPIVGYHRQLSIEGLLSLRPSHLLGSDEMGPDTTLKQLTSAGVVVQALPSGNHLDDFNARIDILAKLTDTQAKAAQIKTQVKAQLAKLQQNKPAAPAKVLFMMISKGRPITVAGAGTTTHTVIELAGAINPVAEHSHSYKSFSSEAILQMQPDVILLAERTYDQLGGIAGLVAEQPLLAQTPAVKNQRVIAIPSAAIQGGFGLASLTLAENLQHQLASATGANAAPQ